MDDLAKRLNISKRTLYENFHSKNEIIERILFDKSQDFYNLHKQILEDDNLDTVTSSNAILRLNLICMRQSAAIIIDLCLPRCHRW